MIEVDGAECEPQSIRGRVIPALPSPLCSNLVTEIESAAPINRRYYIANIPYTSSSTHRFGVWSNSENLSEATHSRQYKISTKLLYSMFSSNICKYVMSTYIQYSTLFDVLQ